MGSRSDFFVKNIGFKEPQNYIWKLFLGTPQKYATTQSAFWTNIFHDKVTLWYIKLTTSRKKNLHLISNIYVVLSSLEIQTRPIQIKAYYKFLYSVWEETTHKSSKVETGKEISSSAYVIGTTCFDKCFLSHVITGRHFRKVFRKFFQKSLLLPGDSFQQPYSCFLLSKWFERSPYFFIFYLQNNSTTIIPNFQNEAVIYHTC